MRFSEGSKRVSIGSVQRTLVLLALVSSLVLLAANFVVCKKPHKRVTTTSPIISQHNNPTRGKDKRITPEPAQRGPIRGKSVTFKFSPREKILLKYLLSIKKRLERGFLSIEWNANMNPEILETMSFFDDKDSYEFYTKSKHDEMVDLIRKWIAYLKAKENKKPYPPEAEEDPQEDSRDLGAEQSVHRAVTSTKPKATTSTRPPKRQKVQKETNSKGHKLANGSILSSTTNSSLKFSSTTTTIIESLAHQLNSNGNKLKSSTSSSQSSSSSSSFDQSLTNEQKGVVRQVMKMRSRLAKQQPTGSNRQLVMSRPAANGKAEMSADMFEKMIQTSHLFLQLTDQSFPVEDHLDKGQIGWLRELRDRLERDMRYSARFDSQKQMHSFIKRMLEVNSILSKLRRGLNSSWRNQSNGSQQSSSAASDDHDENSDEDSNAEDSETKPQDHN